MLFARFADAIDSIIRISVIRQPYHRSKCTLNSREQVKKPHTEKKKLAPKATKKNGQKNTTENGKSIRKKPVPAANISE